MQREEKLPLNEALYKISCASDTLAEVLLVPDAGMREYLQLRSL